MTRLPAESWNVQGIDGPKYKVGPLCSAPGCSRSADHAHHIWRRSFLAGDFAWVLLVENDVVVQNLTGLCWRHHEAITVNKAQISLMGASFVWLDGGTPYSGMNLDPQPLHRQRISGEWVLEFKKDAVTSDGTNGHEHGPGAVEKCPTCKRAIPREKTGDEPKRPRKSWTITVPKDERENGAAVLDSLLRECAVLFGHDEEAKNVRYFTLVQALALVVQHGEQMMGDA